MTDEQTPRSSRRTTAIIVAVLVVVIAAVVVGVIAGGGGAAPASTTNPPAAAASASTGTGASSGTTTSAPVTTATPKVIPTKATGSTPQPTKTASISKPSAVPIKKSLTASVVKMEAVTGTANGPGEIGGPSVRFTISITNSTGKTFALSNTVVNAYYGSAATPAVQLESPGAKAFPASLANGETATGVFVFNIPKASRSMVKVTVDTSVQNPVIAFQGSAPKG